ncbi:MAG: aspartyl-phosphate phosphatase Spo0E family protein [Desulfotomaculaceae bacterium]|nr:aspartyl-phosphate phosphatase Spo0E family protein [Desulfotomaculaceae bacterium]
MHCSELLEEIEELRSEMYSLFRSDTVNSKLLDISQQLDDLIVRYYRRVA